MHRFRVYCDCNHCIDPHTFGLAGLGTQADLARYQLTRADGMAVTLYDHDTGDDGASEWLVADAIVVRLPDGGWAAAVAPSAFRHEPRFEHSATIPWTARHQALGLPTALRVVHSAWPASGATTDGWSLACDFMRAPSDQGTPSAGIVQFVAAEAPHHALRAGAMLHGFEPSPGQQCVVEVLD